MRDVSYTQWARHPEHGWFCPFGCHIRINMTRPHDIKYGLDAPEHLPTCAITIATKLRESGAL